MFISVEAPHTHEEKKNEEKHEKNHAHGWVRIIINHWTNWQREKERNGTRATARHHFYLFRCNGKSFHLFAVVATAAIR